MAKMFFSRINCCDSLWTETRWYFYSRKEYQSGTLGIEAVLKLGVF